MHDAARFLMAHGLLVLFLWVFVEQLGLPIPSIPLLLAAGTLAGTGRLSFTASLLVAVAGAVAADLIWYDLGRRRGIRVLQFLCRISLEPDSCVRRTQGVFERHGARSLLVSKFLPGLNAVASPLAGVFRMRPVRFALFDTLGSLFWAGSILGLGFAFSTQIDRLAQRALLLGSSLLAILLGSFAVYIAWKYLARQRFIRELRISRITVEELKAKMEVGEDLVIVDLRQAMDFEADPESIPGAQRVDAADLAENDDLLPRDRDVILYCTCPNEATSAKLAMILRKKGIQRIRPLQGGLDAWRRRGYPVETQAAGA